MSYKILATEQNFEVYINGAYYCSVGDLKKASVEIEKYKRRRCK